MDLNAFLTTSQKKCGQEGPPCNSRKRRGNKLSYGTFCEKKKAKNILSVLTTKCVRLPQVKSQDPRLKYKIARTFLMFLNTEISTWNK